MYKCVTSLQLHSTMSTSSHQGFIWSGDMLHTMIIFENSAFGRFVATTRHLFDLAVRGISRSELQYFKADGIGRTIAEMKELGFHHDKDSEVDENEAVMLENVKDYSEEEIADFTELAITRADPSIRFLLLVTNPDERDELKQKHWTFKHSDENEEMAKYMGRNFMRENIANMETGYFAILFYIVLGEYKSHLREESITLPDEEYENYHRLSKYQRQFLEEEKRNNDLTQMDEWVE